MWHFSLDKKSAEALDPAVLKAKGITLNPLLRLRALRDARRPADDSTKLDEAAKLERAENLEYTIEWLEDQAFFSVDTPRPPSIEAAEQWVIDAIHHPPETITLDNHMEEVGELIGDPDYLDAIR